MSEIYSVSGDTVNGSVSEPLLIKEINDSAIVTPLIGLKVVGDILTITFTSAIGGDITILDAIVAAHGGPTPTDTPGDKVNLTASAPPTVNDDSTQDYNPGALWIDQTTEDAYMLMTGPAGSAVWKSLTLAADGPTGTIDLRNEGSNLGTFTTLDFVGERVVATDAGAGVAQVAIRSRKFDAYTNPAIEPTVPTSPTFLDITLDTTRTISSGDFTVNAGPTGVEVLNTGDYLINGRVTTAVTVGTGGGARSITQASLTLNGTAVAGTLASMYNRQANAGENTANIHVILSLTAGDVIGLQVTQTVGTATVVVLAEGSSLTILNV